MTERDGYQAGVPCWVDTAQPDPEAAMRFYAGVFGWEFDGPGPMAGPGGGDPPGQYFVARLRGRDVAGVSSEPSEGAPPVPAWNTYIWVDSADDTSKRVVERRRQRRRGAVRRPACRSHGGARRSTGRGVLRLGAQGPEGRPDRQ